MNGEELNDDNNNNDEVDEVSIPMEFDESSSSEDEELQLPPRLEEVETVDNQTALALEALDNMDMDDSEEGNMRTREEVDEYEGEYNNNNEEDVDEGSSLLTMPCDETLAEYECDEHRAWMDLIFPRMERLIELCDPAIGLTNDPRHNMIFVVDFQFYREHGFVSYRTPEEVNSILDVGEIQSFSYSACIHKSTALPVMNTAFEMIRNYDGKVNRDYMHDILDSLSKRRQKSPKLTPELKMTKIAKLASVVSKILDRLQIPYVLYLRNGRSARSRMIVYGKLCSKACPIIQFIRSAFKTNNPTALKMDLLDSGAGFQDPGVVFIQSLSERN